MVEFERYGLPRFRTWVGALEIAGALGLVAGYFLPPLDLAASAGLCLLMAGGVLVRARIRDPFHLMLPAIVLMSMNGFLFLHLLP